MGFGASGYAISSTHPNGWICQPCAQEENALLDRFSQADQFWRSWELGDPWTPVQSHLVGLMEQALGPHTNYYALDSLPPLSRGRVIESDLAGAFEASRAESWETVFD